MQIRHARPGDEDQLAALLEDHERHYGFPVREGAGAEGAAYLAEGGTLCLVADEGAKKEGAKEEGTKLVGFAILNPYFPGPRLSHGLYLKELYIAAPARSAGLGEKMIEAIRALAKQRGDTRVLWTTGEDNKDSQRFYDRLGIRREKKVYYVMDT
jgi:ribosomal protein S18 acetylase RimI-like enzyme